MPLSARCKSAGWSIFRMDASASARGGRPVLQRMAIRLELTSPAIRAAKAGPPAVLKLGKGEEGYISARLPSGTTEPGIEPEAVGIGEVSGGAMGNVCTKRRIGNRKCRRNQASARDYLTCKLVYVSLTKTAQIAVQSQVFLKLFNKIWYNRA